MSRMTTTFELVAPGFANPQAAAADLSKNTGLTITVVDSPTSERVLYASLVDQFTEACAANAGISGRPGCAYWTDGRRQADDARWVRDIYGADAETAALKHECYHLLASAFQSIATHSTNPRSLMFASWNPRQPPGFTSEDRRLLKAYYSGGAA